MPISKLIGEKQQWRQYKARIRKLPAKYRATVDALERYLLHLGPADGANAASMFEDLADLFEQSAADGTPVRQIVGGDPIEFIEAFLHNYPSGKWRSREMQRLIQAVERATIDEA